MSGALKAVSNATLGFLGLNTQEAGVTLESGYATKAINCVIDKFGRLGSRRGWQKLTTTPNGLNTSYLESLFEFIDVDRTSTFLSAGNAKLFSGVTTLTEVPVKAADQTTTVTTSFTGNRWQFQQLAEGAGMGASMYGFATQGGNSMLVYRRASHSGAYIWQKVGDYGAKPTGVTTFDPDSCHAAFGRIWVSGVTGAKSTVYFSKLLDGANFTGTGSGFVDIASVVGNNDEVVAISSHNGFLFIFCRNNIIIYQNATDPTSTAFALQDVITGVGCIARDSVQQTGTDLIFLSKGGLRSLNRVIAEKSSPMRDLSANIHDDLVTYVGGEVLNNIKSVYYERDAFYLLVLPGLNQTIYFDLKQQLPNGAARATIWDNIVPKALCSTSERKLYLGMKGGVGFYNAYSDDGESYRLEYFTQNTDAGVPFMLKFLKKARVVIVASGTQDLILKYGFDYKPTYTSRTYTKDFIGANSEYNIAEYNIGEFTSGTAIAEVDMNLGGSGKILQFGVEATIFGTPVSLQQLSVYLKMGKMV